MNQHDAGAECHHNDDSAAAAHLSVLSLLEDVESSDLQFHSIHMTNRSVTAVS